MLYVLQHMARQERPISSEQIGTMLDTNAAVVRRTLAGLRKAGYVRAEKGRNGGWRIGCDLNRVTLLGVPCAEMPRRGEDDVPKGRAWPVAPPVKSLYRNQRRWLR